MSATATVLVVDDSATMRNLVGGALSAAGWKVVSAANGQEAIAAAGRANIDLVITDWNMPDGDGLQLISTVRGEPGSKSVPILVLSTETDPACRLAAREAGATGWLGKPVDPAMLVDIARSLVHGNMSDAGGGPSVTSERANDR